MQKIIYLWKEVLLSFYFKKDIKQEYWMFYEYNNVSDYCSKNYIKLLFIFEKRKYLNKLKYFYVKFIYINY